MKLSGIYQIKNSVNGKVYVGSAIDIYARWKKHRTELRTGKHHCSKLMRAWQKYGEQSFEFGVLELVPPERSALLGREQYWIDVTGAFGVAGYNELPKAGSHLGAKRSAESIERLRQAMVGRTFSAETLEKMRQKKLGTKRSEESKLKQSASLKGRKMSAECIKKRIATAAKKPNASGYVGVEKISDKCWAAKVKRGGVSKHIGCFPSAAEAHIAREKYLETMA